ncbi:MAG TPA: hypothetical protein VGI39_12395 [Polyangiaceae bacterium]|jgi:hypothetical protein
MPARDPISPHTPNRDDELAALRRDELRGKLMALASGAMALLSLGVSAYTVTIQRQQLKAQVWPRLAMVDHTTGTFPDIETGSALKNRGVAPAEVRTMHVFVDGVEVPNWYRWVLAVAKRNGTAAPKGNWKVQVHSPVGEVIAAGEEISLFQTSSREVIAALIGSDSYSGTRVSICYCSMIGDCWEYTGAETGEETTTSVPACPSTGANFRGWDEENAKENVPYVRRALAEHAPDGGPRDAAQ